MAQVQDMQGSQMAQQPQMPPNNQPAQTTDSQEPKKSKKWVWILILCLIVLGGAAYYLFGM